MATWLRKASDWIGFTNPDVDLPDRPPIGMAGKAALKDYASVMQDILNRQLVSDIGILNRNLGSANRIQGGLRGRLIGEAQLGARSSLGDILREASLQTYATGLQAQMQREQMDTQIALAEAGYSADAGESNMANIEEIAKLIALTQGGGA